MKRHEDEFELIYHSNYKRIYSFLHKLSGSSEIAEELTQETFYQAYLSLSRYDGSCRMYTWLCAIGKNQFLKYVRKNRLGEVTLDLYVTDLAAPATAEPGYRLVRKLEIEELRLIIQNMPKKYSDVLILRVYGELSYDEIANKLGISVSSAKVIFYRAKKYIKEVLSDE